MPQYEFVCTACDKQFFRNLSLEEYERGNVECPHCGSRDVEQNWSDFYAITPRKSA